MKTELPQILLTNDDGIQSPGLWAAAGALSELGYVHVVAPRDQFSGAGRGLPSNSDGIINSRQMQVNGKSWTVYSVGGTPAQSVLHGILEIMPAPPDLVVSGINYGENVGVLKELHRIHALDRTADACRGHLPPTPAGGICPWPTGGWNCGLGSSFC